MRRGPKAPLSNRVSSFAGADSRARRRGMSPSGRDPCRVQRRKRAASRVETPPRVVVDLARGELELDDPAGRLLPARPAFARCAGLDQLGAHRAAESGVDVGIELGAEEHRDGESLTDDVLALGEHGPLEPRDVFDARAEQRGYLVCGHAGTDVHLDVARTRADDLCVAVSFLARLAKLDAQNVVDGEREPITRLGDQDEHIVFGSDDFELFHAKRPSDPAVCAHGVTGVVPRREYPARAASFTATQARICSRICEMGSGRANYRRPTGSVHHCYSPGS